MKKAKGDRMAENESKAPIFIKVDEYKEVLDLVNLLKSKLEEASGLIEEINELKNREDTEVQEWESNLKEVEKRLAEIDRILVEPEV